MPGHRMKLYQQPERMKRMTLQQCRYIMEIERCRSLTEAAKRLFVTQPSITKAVRELEKELGITILKRTNRGIDFTPEGKELAAYGLVFTQLATLPEHVILSRRHPLSAFSTLRPEQLAPYPYITFRKDDTLLDITESYFTIGRASRQIFVEDRATMNYLVVHTDSYCLGTGCLSEGFIPPDIVPIPLDVPWNLCVGYLQRKDALLSEECLRFIRHLRQALQDSLPLRS